MVAELRDGRGALHRPGPRVHRPGRRRRRARRPVLVVDRPGWIQANADGFDLMLAPFVDKVTAKKGPPSGLTKAVGSRVTGAEVGALLGFLGGKVLGQFDPFHAPSGRLLLVAPNIVHVERELDVDPTDFRLWVCLHEETHRVQFTAVPWLRDHLLERDRHGCPTSSSRPGCSTTASSGLVRGAQGRVDGGSLLDIARHPRAARDHRPAHRRDVAARGPRRRGDGRRRARASSRRSSEIRTKFNPPPPGRRGPRPAAAPRCSASTPRWRSTATAPRSSAAVVDKVGMDDFNAVWADPAEPAHQGRDRRPGRLGAPRPRLTRGRRRPDPAVAARPASPYGGRSPPATPASAARRWSPAPAAPTRWRCWPPPSFEAREQPAGPSSASPSTTGCRTAPPRSRPHVVGQMAALGADETASIRVKVEGDGHGPEAAARQARYAVLEELADRFGAVAVLLGHTLDDQAETVLLGLTRGSGGRSLAGMRRTFGVVPPAAARRHPRPDRAGLPGPGHRAWWTDPHNDDPRFTRVRVRRDVLPAARGRARARASPQTLARTADLLRADADALDDLADAAYAVLGPSRPSPWPRSLAARARRPHAACCALAALARRRPRRRAVPRARPRPRRAADRLARPAVRSTCPGAGPRRTAGRDAGLSSRAEPNAGPVAGCAAWTSADVEQRPRQRAVHRGADPGPARRAGRARSRRTTRARTCCSSASSTAP